MIVEDKPQAEQREFIVTHGTPMLVVTTDSIIAKINFMSFTTTFLIKDDNHGNYTECPCCSEWIS